MDPISAFGLAGTILQFIDSGIKFAKVISKVHSGSNVRSESQESIFDLMKLTKAFIEVLKTFQSQPSNTGICTTVKKDGLALLADECVEITETVLQRLRRLGFPDKPPTRKRDAFKEVIKASFSQKDIDAIRLRLNGFHDQFNFHLLVSLQHYATQSLAKQEETLEALNISSQNSKKLEMATNSILDQLASKAIFKGEIQWQSDLRVALVAQIYRGTETWTRHTATNINLAPETRITMEKTILSTLKYHGMEDRQGRISDTYKTTFQWILSEGNQSTQKWQKQSLRTWLESDEQIYWISGKAGSGKSTLMKYLCQPTSDVEAEAHPHHAHVANGHSRTSSVSRCRPFLLKWAGGSEVVIASFYFWISDAGGLQKSYEGLLRSLLYQILVARPEVIPQVLPSRWEALSIFGVHPELSSWTDSQLHHALELSVDTVTTDATSKICFFIDGLDEFEGKSTDLLGLIQALAQKGSHTKFCVASRPWVAFQDAFETKPHLKLEDFNYADIRYFVASRLEEDAEYLKLCRREPEFANELVENIVSKASGVFLWVHLVVASLLSGMSFGDRIEDLQRRLDLLPPDLENLYDRMLQDLDPFYLEHAAQLILLMEASNRALPLIVFSFADTETVESLKNLPSVNTSSSAIDLRVDSMSRRLNSRWKGMLEVNRREQTSLDPSGAQRTVQYLHRTVKDFIQSDKVQRFLESSIKSTFDPHLKLCIAWCAYIKTRPQGPTGLLVEPDAIMQHAARVMITSEPDMLEVLDHLSEVVHTSLQSRAYPPANRRGYTRKEILSLAVTCSVFAYVKARLHPEQEESLCTEMLLHAVREPQNLDGPMIVMLLDMGADVTEMSGYSPWKTLLARIADMHRKPIKSLATLDDASRVAVVAMVANRAPVDEAREHYVQAFKNRFGMREVTSSSVFTDGFFDELKTVKVTRKSKRSQQFTRWLKSRGKS